VFTVGDQIAEAIVIQRAATWRAARAQAVELLEAVRIIDPSQRARQYPHQLSGGMRQRVMIAVALACHPPLVIADEPTTALDVTIQAEILDLLRELRDRYQLALLLITHDLGVIAEMADTVAVMYAGTIVEHAPVRDVFKRPAHAYTRRLLSSIPGAQTVERE
jgi:oligopeptide transport system ATP-binding protein